MERLTYSADPGTRVFQFSSYDRNSRIENGQKKDWFANVDRGYYLREERTDRGVELVMAEHEGPGAILRIWSANAGGTTWRIYLDGNPEPVIEGVGRKLLGGKLEPFGPAFADRRNLGFNLIFPIPFQKSCRVTLSPVGKEPKSQPLGRYYHINIRAYPEGTRVETFRSGMLDEYAEKIESIGEKLTNPLMSVPRGVTERTFDLTVAPGQEGTLLQLSGPSAIYSLEVEARGTGGNKELNRILQECVLIAHWDDDPLPGIRVPLGTFFGTSPGVNPYVSLPLEMQKTEDGARMVSRWVMPFQSSAVLKLANFGDARVRISGKAEVAPRDWDERSLHFNASYRKEDFYPTRPLSDWTLLDAKGEGRLVGIEMSIRTPDKSTWWGEGDEKIYVDGEKFPGTFGTGTEDYFGYAWGTDWKTFWHAYHGVTRAKKTNIFEIAFFILNMNWKKVVNEVDSGAIVSQYRWHILDSIPFQESLLFDMEVWHWTKTITVDLTGVAYWYARPGSIDRIPVISGEELNPW
jgi:hypothetical protein